jgi:putative ATP-dependent endonuclease of the OLD family
MFFTRIPILVEGLEDASYISNHLHLTGKWSEFRRLGYHFIPVNGKDKLIQPRAIAKELHILCFVIFDADGDTTKLEHQVKHERDNLALMTLIGCKKHAFPDTPVLGADHAIWPTNLTTLN